MITPPQQLLKPCEVAEIFRVHVRTVQRWAKNNKLPYILTPGGQCRFRLTDVEKLLKVKDQSQSSITKSN